MDYKNPFFLTVLDKGYNSVDTARNFLKMNVLTPAQISEGTGLPLDEVNRLAVELKKEAVQL